MTRVRPTWPDLPAHVRDAVVAKIDGPVTAWTSHDGGYSPGWALTLESPAGSAFVKVASTEYEVAARLHRREAQRAAALPDGVPAPAFRWIMELPDAGLADRSWVVIASDVVHGRAPRTEPWDLDDLDRLQHLARRIAQHEVPVGGAYPAFDSDWPEAALLADERPAGLATYDPWLAANLDRIAEIASPERQAEALAGPHLVHADLRADNALVVRQADGAEEAVAVDWPHAMRGASFLDRTGLLPAVHATGGPAPEQVLERTPLPAGVDPEAVTVWVAVQTAYFVRTSLEDPPPGIPHVRAFQRIQAEACIPWLRDRLHDA